jgi:hypothetical protein
LLQLSSAGARTQRGFVDRRENCGVWTARAVVHKEMRAWWRHQRHLQRGEHNALFIGKTDILIGERAPGMDQVALFCLRFFMHLDMKLRVMSAQIDVNTHPAMTMG